MLSALKHSPKHSLTAAFCGKALSCLELGGFDTTMKLSHSHHPSLSGRSKRRSAARAAMTIRADRMRTLSIHHHFGHRLTCNGTEHRNRIAVQFWDTVVAPIGKRLSADPHVRPDWGKAQTIKSRRVGMMLFHGRDMACQNN